MIKNHNLIGLISLPAIYNIALKHIIDNISDRNCEEFIDTKNLIDSDKNPNRLITTSFEFLTHLDFFMPRKDSVMILTAEKDISNSFEGNYISIYDDEATIFKKLTNFIAEKNYDNENKVVLSKREIDVLKQIVAGKTNKEIADSLYISVNTVITHRKNLSLKLGIRSVSGLSLYALMNGII